MQFHRFKRFVRRSWAASLLACAVVVQARPAAADLTVVDLTAGAVNSVGPFYQDVEDAIKLFAAKDVAGAFKHLEAAKKSTPRLAPPEVMMAQLYFDSGQAPAGTAMLERAIHQPTPDPEPFVILAERALGEGRTTEAGLLFERAMKQIETLADNPRRKQKLQGRAYAGSGSVDENDGNLKQAQQKYEELIKVDPGNGKAHERLARVLFRAGDLKRAYTEFQSAAESNKELSIAEIAMAALAMEKNDQTRAEQWIKLAITKGPTDLRSRLGATEFYLRFNRVDEAKVQADEALKLDPNGLDANMIVGIIARMQGDLKKAEKHLGVAHLLAPANAVINNHLALVLIDSQDQATRQRALQYAELNAKYSPTIPEVVATLGWVNFRLDRRLEAQRAFNIVLASAGGSQTMASDMAYYMAHLAAERGQTADAIKMLREALNTTQPFAYRKPAQAMLDQLVKQEKTAATKPKAATADKAAGTATKGEDKSDGAN
jgi:tetratricopeptide (TPR) repeat protein